MKADIISVLLVILGILLLSAAGGVWAYMMVTPIR